jgi:hypothetical protein
VPEHFPCDGFFAGNELIANHNREQEQAEGDPSQPKAPARWGGAERAEELEGFSGDAFLSTKTAWTWLKLWRSGE